MNIVVVTRYTSDKGEFIHDATEWVLRNSVDRTLYSVGMDNNVRIGPYIIRFVCRPDALVGLRIDIAYYYGIPIGDSMIREIECRMVPGGKIYINLHCFMKEVFRRAKEELIKAKLNGLFGYRPRSINYPEYFLKLKEESQNKISDVQDILLDYDVATVYNAVREAMDRIKYEKMALLKEETTMNCDIRSNIKDVIFNYPATIILWKDGTKTIVKVRKGEKYDPEKGFAMAVCKKMFGNEGNYYKVFKEYVPTPYYIPEKNDIIVKDLDVAEETSKIIEDIIVKWRLKHKEWPGLTRRKWKELINKAAKRVEERRKREKAKADHKEKQKGIRSGRYPWGIDLSNYMTPPEGGVNSSGKEE